MRIEPDGTVGAEARRPTPGEGEALLDAITETVRQVGPVGYLGVGVPGLVDQSGVLRFAPNLPGVVDLAVRAGLQQRFPGAVVTVGNDATCAAWAERDLGAGRGSDELLMVTLGTGIGGGIVSNGQLLLGANGFAGEFGHMVVDPHGPRCPCGKRGCWERFASGSGLGRLAREAAQAGDAPGVVRLAGGDAEAVRGEHVTAAAAHGDAGAIAIIEQFAWWLAVGLANLANIFDPDCIVIGGGLTVSGGVMLAPTTAAFADLVEAVEHRPPISIVLAHFGERAGAIGAGLLAQASGGAAGRDAQGEVGAGVAGRGDAGAGRNDLRDPR